jgi:hypothetical protein
MRHQKFNRVPEFTAESAGRPEFAGTIEQYAQRAPAVPGLSGHVRQLRNRNRGISRWLVLAIFAGAVAALALVQFAVR